VVEYLSLFLNSVPYCASWNLSGKEQSYYKQKNIKPNGLQKWKRIRKMKNERKREGRHYLTVI
jgi:hypothetical protein